MGGVLLTSCHDVIKDGDKLRLKDNFFYMLPTLVSVIYYQSD